MLLKPTKRRKKKPESIMKYAKDYCEYCRVHGRPAHDSASILDAPHHLTFKGLGGSSNPEIHSPDNLITLCRYHHDCAHHNIPGEYISREQLREVKEGNDAN